MTLNIYTSSQEDHISRRPSPLSNLNEPTQKRRKHRLVFFNFLWLRCWRLSDMQKHTYNSCISSALPRVRNLLLVHHARTQGNSWFGPWPTKSHMQIHLHLSMIDPFEIHICSPEKKFMKKKIKKIVRVNW